MNEGSRSVRGIVDGTRPISLAAALSAGVSAKLLRGRGFRRIQHGIYVPATVPDSLLLRVRAAMLAAPRDALVSHHSAAELWGGVVPRQSEVHLSVASTSRWSGPSGVAIHSTVDSRERGRRHGLPLTSPEATFLDLARQLELVDLVVLGDSLVRRRATTPEKLAAVSEQWRGGGARKAREAAGLVRAGVDSPQEARVRLLIVFAGLPEPVVNFRIFNDDGTVSYRCDLAWPELRISVEYDGRQHAEDSRQWGRDVGRREYFDDAGWRMMVVRSPDLWLTPGNTIDRLVKVRQQRGATPTRPMATWRRHFPGRLAIV